MKTQIITLESHDDLISVRDKLSWAKTPRILLVWPKYEDVTLRLLDLKFEMRFTRYFARQARGYFRKPSSVGFTASAQIS